LKGGLELQRRKKLRVIRRVFPNEKNTDNR
jgi:hypothetical protein